MRIRPLRATLGVATTCLACSMSAITSVSAQEPLAVDSVRLLSDVSVLAHDSMQGRATGTAGGLRALRFLERRIEETGAAPAGGSYVQAFPWPGGTGANVVAVVPGRDPEADVIVLTAHFDHEGVLDGLVYNGADDNASGTAAALEIARLVHERPLRHTLVVALLDAEEQGFWGARALLDRPPVPRERIALNVNLDMVARTDGVLWAAGASHTPALRPVLEQVAARSPTKLRLGHDRPGAPEGEDWTQSSDHAVFHAAGIPFVYLGVEDHEDYHRPTDDYERIDPGDFVASVRTIVAVLRALDGALPLADGG